MKTVLQLFKKLKIELPYDQAIPFLGVYSKEQLKHGSSNIHCWMAKQNVAYTKEYYSALKRKEILTYATTWRKLEDIVLSEISQSQKENTCTIPLIQDTQSSLNHREEKQNGCCQDLWGEGYGELLLNGYRVLVLQTEELWRWMVVMVA